MALVEAVFGPGRIERDGGRRWWRHHLAFLVRGMPPAPAGSRFGGG